MATFPTPKIHRVSRRKLGRGQSVAKTPVNATATAATTTVTITFDQPVVVSGPIDLNFVTPLSPTSWVQPTPTTLHQVYSLTRAGLAWSIKPHAPVRSFLGGTLAPTSGTFSS